MKDFMPLIEDPVRDDSEDLDSEEVLRATYTSSADDLVNKIKQQVQTGEIPYSHELRRKGGHMYHRVRLKTEGEPDRTLLFQIDWVVDS